ncbi:RHS repeat-associated core domain-containing protein [Streptomyces werraensis]|uniref:hypothetical protein n=1 Tax=Streptomyces werraensis TaxID=68284 RepID=UPI0037F58957
MTGGKSYFDLTDATGKRTHTYAYGPTGMPHGTTTEAAPQPFRYAGAYADPTGLYKMGHRSLPLIRRGPPDQRAGPAVEEPGLPVDAFGDLRPAS